MEERAILTAMGAASAKARHELERFLGQARFAEGLCGLYVSRAPRWRPLIDRAAQAVSSGIGSGSARSVRAAVRRAEEIMAPIGKSAKRLTVLCAGHAHIDMNWMWSWPETVSVTNDTFLTVLRLMDEYPEFCFTQSQASVYAIVADHNPELLGRIRRRVAEGRWEVAASHWVEGDKNIGGHESMCRHLLYTRRYMRELFGLEPEDVPIDWSPDTFGHAHTVPTYLTRGAVTRYYCCRAGRHGPERPAAFRWQGPDGSEVLVFRDPAWYNGIITPDVGKGALGFLRETGLRTSLFVFGVGDHGGGPTRRDIERALDMDTWPIFPNVRLSTTAPFYKALERVREKLPVLDCELNFEFEGCYTSQSLIKKINRLAEERLCDAETAAGLTWAALGRDYPTARLREGWQDTLFSHFHDILPGSGVHGTRTYAHGLFQKTAAMTHTVETQALRALAARIDTRTAAAPGPAALPPSQMHSRLGAGVGFGTETGALSPTDPGTGQGARPFMVFNPCATGRGGVVVATLWDNPPPSALGGAENALRHLNFSALGPDGARSPAQIVGHGDYWGHEYVRVAFPVATVPGLGYALYTVVEEETSEGAKMVSKGPLAFENEFISVELDATTGGVRSLVDRASGLDLVDPARPACVLYYAVERPHDMTAWRIDETGPEQALKVRDAIRRTDWGPHVASAEVKLRANESDFTLRYELRMGDPVLRVTLDGMWVERGGPEIGVPCLKVVFPLALSGAGARYEIPFGAIERDLNGGEELPALRWAQVGGRIGRRKAGCLVISDSKHGHALDGNELRMSLIRSSYEPDLLPEIGRHTVRLGLHPFAGDLSVARAVSLAAARSHDLRVVATDVHEGDLTADGAFLGIGPESVVLCSLKKAEAEDALVLRMYETAGKPATARMQFNPAMLGAPVEAVETDIMERPLAESTARISGDTVLVDVPARGIATVLVRLCHPPLPDTPPA